MAEKVQTAEKISDAKQLSRLPARRETQLLSRPSQLPETDVDLLDAALKAAGLSRKELAYVWRVSRQQVDQILQGIKPSPLRRTVELFALLASRGQAHRIPEFAGYLTRNFNLRVLDAEQTEAFNKIVGGMKP